MDQALINTYEAGGESLREAYKGLLQGELLAFPIPNTWSLQQIAVHLWESDMIASDRMKRIACMDRPLLMGYDETAFSKLPGADEIDAHEAVDLFARNRKLTATVLRRLPSSAFDRTGVHNERGLLTLGELVRSYITHLEGHLKWAVKKREMLGQT